MKESIRIRPIASKAFLLTGAAIILSGIVVDMVDRSSGQIFVRWNNLKFFTYQSNIFTAIVFVLLALFGNKLGRFRHYLSFTSMLAITVTGVVYNFVLTPSGDPNILSSYGNFVTHFLSTILALTYYFVFEARRIYKIRHLIVATLFPLSYWIIFVSIGELISFYPYFFMDISDLGWGLAFVWLIALIVAFVALGYLLVLYDHKSKVNRRDTSNQE